MTGSWVQLDPQATDAAAGIIWSAWQDGRVIEALPEPVRPRERLSGYGVQARLSARSNQAPAGWKIAATSAAGQAHIGVAGPIAGRLLGERVHRSGTTLSLSGNRMLVAEPEFAFRAGQTFTPRENVYSVVEVMAGMDALLPAIEVPNSRFEDFAKAGEAQLIADNACAHEFVLGEPATCDWRSLDLAAHPVSAAVTGRYERAGSGVNVLGDPRVALSWLVNELSGLGIELAAGQVVTTGTSMVPLEIGPGDHVMADFGRLGRIDVRFN